MVTVTATGGGTIGSAVTAPHLYSPGEGPSAAVVLMVDCSGSMDHPPTKMRNARDATAAAIDTLRDGVHFAVVAGTHLAREVYPGDGRLAVAGPDTREQAKQALRKLSAGGGTAIGTWLRRADRLLASADVAIRHGILLTDGRNEHESPEDLKAALDTCAGRFTCDARGVGTDWEVKEVTGIASALLGTADIVADPAGLAADFTRMMETAMGKEVADVSLRLWTPAGATVTFVKQVAPTVEELTGRRTEAAPARATTRSVPGATSPVTTTSVWRCRPPPWARRCSRRASRWSSRTPTVACRTSARRGWCGPCGRTTWPRRRRSTLRSPTTRARPNWRKSSKKGWIYAKWETSTEQRPNWAVPFSSRAPPATLILRNCLRRWWTSSTPRPVLCD